MENFFVTNNRKNIGCYSLHHATNFLRFSYKFFGYRATWRKAFLGYLFFSSKGAGRAKAGCWMDYGYHIGDGRKIYLTMKSRNMSLKISLISARNTTGCCFIINIFFRLLRCDESVRMGGL
jgi:hypothetical protein